MLFTLSIISHGHGEDIRLLLTDLSEYCGTHTLRILLTINAPDLETVSIEELKHISKWPLHVKCNEIKQGFAKNHNSLLRLADSGIWCVVNPDIRLPAFKLEELFRTLALEEVGLAFPKQVGLFDESLDYRRKLVTPWSLLNRYIRRVSENTASTDWVSGCFMAFRSEVYQILGGFDEKYFLYCEDVDICLRLQLAGYKMVEADFSIVHDTRRGTLKKFDHFKWHVASLLKLWCSRSFWAYLWNRSKIKAR